MVMVCSKAQNLFFKTQDSPVRQRVNLRLWLHIQELKEIKSVNINQEPIISTIWKVNNVKKHLGVELKNK